MWWWLVASAGGVLSGWGILSTARMLHPKPKLLQTTSSFFPTRTESVVTENGQAVEVWVFEAAKPRGLVIGCHGYHANRLQLVDLAHGLCQRGYTTALFDLRGHGTRRGRCTFGTSDTPDVSAILEWLRQQPTFQQLPVGLVGFSFGGAVACQVAAIDPQIGAVVADSAYARLFPILAHAITRDYHLSTIPWAWVTWLGVHLALGRCVWRLDPIRLASHTTAALLLIHGGHDESVPIAQAQALYARWHGPKEQWIRPGIGHVEAFADDPAGYCNRVARFFDRWLQPSAPRSSPS